MHKVISQVFVFFCVSVRCSARVMQYECDNEILTLVTYCIISCTQQQREPSKYHVKSSVSRLRMYVSGTGRKSYLLLLCDINMNNRWKLTACRASSSVCDVSCNDTTTVHPSTTRRCS